MTAFFYYPLCLALACGILYGISMMSRVESAVRGNRLSAACAAAAILLTLYHYQIMAAIDLWICMALGLVGGIAWMRRIKMIDMPQIVALLNGFGGISSTLVASVSALDGPALGGFALTAAGLALVVGMVTFVGSLVAAGKLHRVLPQRPVVWPAHRGLSMVALLMACTGIVLLGLNPNAKFFAVLLCGVASAAFGLLFSVRVGGADMPITISLLNSFSGVAASIAGMAISDPLLVAVGGIVGASGLLLTQVMCRAMNRSLIDILAGGKAAGTPKPHPSDPATHAPEPRGIETPTQSPAALLLAAKRIIIIPGYGMALAQAQQTVKRLADRLERNGAVVDFAIHPVAGRMPGHMNVLLAEADVPYEKLRAMDEVNPEFADCDAAIIVGANDVVNPAANTEKGTPIYGMPVLDAAKAKNLIVCNMDLNPGYAGVPNPLYKRPGTILLLGNAADTLRALLDDLETTPEGGAKENGLDETGAALRSAKRVILIPGYGMALAQAQVAVKELADRLERNGAIVDFAIHPVAGRMPGHMNVLLAEANVPYEKLREMDLINSEFADCDIAVIVGANDVVNPAANSAEGTPIFGMPILRADLAKRIVICNFDKNPGYAGVENPLYAMRKVDFLLGDAAKTVRDLISLFERE